MLSLKLTCMEGSLHNITDSDLITSAKSGDRKSLDLLIRKYQNWIFNVAVSFVGDKNDAADITQEVLIKVVTHLSSFNLESNFKTWVFKIVRNHFLNMKRRKYELTTTSFESFANGLDNVPDEDITLSEFKVEREKLIEESKISCLRGMLLCLSREQRLIYILGDIFELPDSIGSEIMEISKGNFRVKLHRARTELYGFMNGKCGLVNKNNPCRCAKKTIGFIKIGCVDPVKLNFQTDIIEEVNRTDRKKLETLDISLKHQYERLFQDMPKLEAPVKADLIKDFISSDEFMQTFNLK